MKNDLEKRIDDHQETGRNPSKAIPEKKKKNYFWIAIAVITVITTLILITTK